MVDFNGNVNQNDIIDLTDQQWADKIMSENEITVEKCPYDASYDDIDYYPNKEAFQEGVDLFVDGLHFVDRFYENRKLMCPKKVVRKDNKSNEVNFIRNGAAAALFLSDGDPVEAVKWYREGYYSILEGGERYKNYVRTIVNKLIEYNPNNIDRTNKDDIFKELAYTTTIGVVTTFLQDFDHELEKELQQSNPEALMDLDNKLQSSFRDQDFLFRKCIRYRYDYPTKYSSAKKGLGDDPRLKAIKDSTGSISMIYTSVQLAHKMSAINSGDTTDLDFSVPYTFSGNVFGRNDFKYDGQSVQDITTSFSKVGAFELIDPTEYDLGEDYADNQMIVLMAAQNTYENIVNLYDGQGNVYTKMAERLSKNKDGITGSSRGEYSAEKSIYINGKSICERVDELCESHDITPEKYGSKYADYRKNIAIVLLAKAMQNPEDVITTIMYKVDEKYKVVPIPINLKKDYSYVVKEAKKLDINQDKIEELDNIQSIQNAKYEENKLKFKNQVIFDFCKNNGKSLDSYNKEVASELYINANGKPYNLNRLEQGFVEGETKDAIEYYKQLKGKKLTPDNIAAAMFILRDINEKHNSRSWFGQYLRPSSYDLRNLRAEIITDLKGLSVKQEDIDNVLNSQNKYTMEFLTNNITLDMGSVIENSGNQINEKQVIDLTKDFDDEYIDDIIIEDDEELENEMNREKER